MHRAIRAACLLLAFSCAPAFAQNAKLLKNFNHWSAYQSAASPKTCFVVSQPLSSEPSEARRGPIYFYVSRYPADRIKNEISIKMGYPFSPGAKVSVNIDGKAFSFYTKEEGAYVETRAGEDQVVEAMKAGSSMTVTGTSSRGTKTTDKYSLSGVTAALSEVERECSF